MGDTAGCDVMYVYEVCMSIVPDSVVGKPSNDDDGDDYYDLSSRDQLSFVLFVWKRKLT